MSASYVSVRGVIKNIKKHKKQRSYTMKVVANVLEDIVGKNIAIEFEVEDGMTSGEIEKIACQKIMEHIDWCWEAKKSPNTRKRVK